MGNNLSDIHLYIIVIDVISCKRVHYKKICHACNTYIYNNKTDNHPLFSDPNKAQSTWMSKANPFSRLFNVWICKSAGTSKCTQTMKASNLPTTVVNCSYLVMMSITVTVHTVNSGIIYS